MTSHRLEVGRKLIVGGIELPLIKGRGAFDGDVLRMRFAMRCWGRPGLGILGRISGDTDPKWKGANSLIFFGACERSAAWQRDFAIEHVDAIVILERPKLGRIFRRCGGRWQGAGCAG